MAKETVAICDDPRVVSNIFAELLKLPGKFAGAFADIVFAVLDRSQNAATFRAFAVRFQRGSL